MIYLGADHAGYKTKEYIRKWLEKNGISYKDYTPKLILKDDYPDSAKKVAKKVSLGGKGILICGTGTGMVIAANKTKKVRAALVYDKYTAIKSRTDNDANIIALRGKGFSKEKALELTKIWFKTKFSGKKRHQRRIKKLG